MRVISSSEADKENVPPSLLRYSNVRGAHQCSIDDELTDDGEQVRLNSWKTGMQYLILPYKI